MLTSYRDRTTQALLKIIPDTGAPYLYDLVGAYPRRLGKGVRGALCLATCAALGGDEHQALNSAVAIGREITALTPAYVPPPKSREGHRAVRYRQLGRLRRFDRRTEVVNVMCPSNSR